MELHYAGVEGLEIERLIFVGDYVDFGPSSKEVADFLIDLPFDKVFLMGNLDDLLLQFVKQSDLFERHGESWSTDRRLQVVQVAAGRGYRRSQELNFSSIYFGC